MERNGRRTRGSTILLVLALLAGRDACAESPGGRLVPWRIERDLLRFRTVATDNVMNVLAIRPGMTILDIGAGTGQFAYEFAARLNGTGMVYATDTNGYCIDYMKTEGDRRGLRNLQPVLVGKDGVDGFYGKHRYDLITVFHLSMTYENQVDYFRELRGTLAEGGRLVLILYKIPTPFSPDDFTGDLRGFIRTLSLEPPESPFYGILKDSTRKRIRDRAEAEPSEELLSAIARDFNDIFSDTRFAARFSGNSAERKYVTFSPEEQRYTDWLFAAFRDTGGLKRENPIKRASEARVYATINKLLIVQRYRRYLKRDGLFLSGFTPSVGESFRKAGYKVERQDPDTIPFEDMIVFSSP